MKRREETRWQRRSATLAVALLMFGALSVPIGRADLSPVRVVGEMRFTHPEDSVPKLVVDPSLHLGAYLTGAKGTRLVVFDLKRLKRAYEILMDPFIPAGVSLDSSLTMDVAHHRVFLLQTGAAINCGDGHLWSVDLVKRKVNVTEIPCYQNSGFQVRGLSYYAPTNKLYMIGETGLEAAYSQLSGSYNYHESTIIRQVQADSLKVDWDIDTSQQCGTNTNIGTGPIVGRAAAGVISYCYVATQGRAVWIPLKNEKPITDANGNPVVRLSPTIGRATRPLIDQESGRLLIQEDKPPFGPAVYVYDPRNERFFGVVPSGVELSQGDVYYDYFRGLDPQTGRLYILNHKGLVIADTRHNPLPGGVSYPVLTNRHTGVFNGPIASDPGLHRLFFPFPSSDRFVVVQDDVPYTPDLPPPDPDAGTSNIPEVEGKTSSTFSAAAAAFGVHVLVTGGIPRIVDNTDPLCTSQTSITNRDQYGRCPLDQMITPGNRDFFVAQSGFDSGLDSGTSAFAGALRNSSSDSATDSDLRGLGRCEADHVPDPGAATLTGLCPNGDGQPLKPFTTGSQGIDGKGYPVRGALCVDFEGKSTHDEGDSNALGSSSVRCDTAKHTAFATASTGVINVAPDGAPTVTVAHATSTVATELAPEGVVTHSVATARGIDIGGQITIGRIRAEATTKAHGVAGTTLADYVLEFRDVHGPNIDCVQCAPRDVVAAINQVFGAFLRARVPDPLRLASPKGFQGVVAKDPALRQSDSAVNDDDTVTVNGLDLIYYNDSAPSNPNGSAGRSRVVIGLAGVEAEARYGIFLLPETSDGTIGNRGGDTVVEGDKFVAPPTDGGSGSVQPPLATGGGVRTVADVFRLVRTRPGEFAMLFVLFSLLATPLYLALRRRALVRSLD